MEQPAVTGRHTTRRKVKADELVEELTIGAAMRLRCESSDIHGVVRAVVAYLMEEYPAQELYIPSSVTWPVEAIRADLAAGLSIRKICQKHRVSRKTVYLLAG